MGKVKQLISEFHQTARQISGENGRSYLVNVWDLLFCAARYGISPEIYRKYDFDRLDGKKRKTYVTNRTSKRMIRLYNQPAFGSSFENKGNFARIFSDVYRREYLIFPDCTREEYARFTDGKHRFVCKPLTGARGLGIIVIEGQIPSYEQLCRRLQAPYILEEYITQHPKLSAFFPNAINCIRVITVCKDGKVTPVVANITFSAGHPVANASFGGITCQIDLKTGILVTDGGAFHHKIYETHPVTGMVFKGFEIPYWNRILEMLDDIGSRVPQVGYVGWDIAIAQDGPMVIEGNSEPGFTFFQIPQQLPGQIGTMERYRPFL